MLIVATSRQQQQLDSHQLYLARERQVMDKHVFANVCVVVEIFPPNVGVGAFGGFLGKNFYVLHCEI